MKNNIATLVLLGLVSPNQAIWTMPPRDKQTCSTSFERLKAGDQGEFAKSRTTMFTDYNFYGEEAITTDTRHDYYSLNLPSDI